MIIGAVGTQQTEGPAVRARPRGAGLLIAGVVVLLAGLAVALLIPRAGCSALLISCEAFGHCLSCSGDGHLSLRIAVGLAASLAAAGLFAAAARSRRASLRP